MRMGRQLRQEVFARIQSLSSQEVASFGAQSLVTRTTNDTLQIQSFAVLVFTMLVAAPVMGAGGIVLALQQDVALSSVIIVIVPVLMAIMYLIVRRLVPLYRDGQELLDHTGEVLREQIIGANIIRAFGRQDHEIDRFAEANGRLTRNNLQSALLVAGMLPLIMIVVNLSSVAVVWFGGHRVHAGDMKLGALTAFIAYILQILLAIMMAMYVLMTGPRASVCAERLRAVLDTPPVLDTPSEGGGRRPAIVGSTGSGKSTLINLLPRFLDATSGHITLAGRDIRAMPVDVLRANMALAPQRSHLFTGTIGDNLRIAAPDAADTELWAALETAEAAGFVRELPLQLRARVGQGGTTLSGGQRQRLCIARALLRHAPLYLFDDSFSALDFDTEARLRHSLETALGHAVVIIVAERISTVAGAGQILVLDDGRLVAEGTHSELLETSSTYREIAESQFASGNMS
jgi:ATP-binding cassette subfamily B protein